MILDICLALIPLVLVAALMALLLLPQNHSIFRKWRSMRLHAFGRMTRRHVRHDA